MVSRLRTQKIFLLLLLFYPIITHLYKVNQCWGHSLWSFQESSEYFLETQHLNQWTHWLALWSSFCFCRLLSTYLSTLLSGTHSSQLEDKTQRNNLNTCENFTKQIQALIYLIQKPTSYSTHCNEWSIWFVCPLCLSWHTAKRSRVKRQINI